MGTATRSRPALRRRTRAQSKADTHERILASAAEVFRRDGYHGASLDRVAAEAGYTKGAVYAAFDSKADLFLALLARRAAERRAEMRNVMAAAQSAEDLVGETARRFARSVAAERDWWTAVIEFMTVVGRDETLRSRYAAHHDSSRVQLAELIDGWTRRLGKRLSIPSRRLATVVMALNNGLTLEWLVAPREVSAQTYADAQVAVLMSMMSPGRRS
jgi:AcrR family transcriptional regulator